MPISIRKNRNVYDESGIAYMIGDLIYAFPDGERIYDLVNCADQVYIEIPDINTNVTAIRRMSNALTEKDGTGKLFWPDKMVRGENDSGFTGFITGKPQTSGKLISLTEIIEQRKEKEALTQEEKKYFLNLGIQLAEIIEIVHNCKYVVGGLAPDQFRVSEEGLLYFCSSYQLAYERVNPFEKPQYVVPEWLSRMNRENIVFNQESDSFLYAIILFQLLTGKYPFLTERDVSEIEKEELWEQMVDGKSLYFWEDSVMIKTIGSELRGLPHEIGSLFRRTFDYCGCSDYCESRASIGEWLQVLKNNN